jgi:hypothetical protein
MKKRLLCGIDVDSKELVVAIDPGTGHIWEGTFRNDAAGHRRSSDALRGPGRRLGSASKRPASTTSICVLHSSRRSRSK